VLVGSASADALSAGPGRVCRTISCSFVAVVGTPKLARACCGPPYSPGFAIVVRSGLSIKKGDTMRIRSAVAAVALSLVSSPSPASPQARSVEVEIGVAPPPPREESRPRGRARVISMNAAITHGTGERMSGPKADNIEERPGHILRAARGRTSRRALLLPVPAMGR